jgi:hypothetical protein
MYEHINPDLNTHAPIISKETYDVVMANADVNIHSIMVMTFLFLL